MKHLFYNISTKAIVFTSCFLLFPNSLLNPKIANTQQVLAQQTTPKAQSSTDESQAAVAKGLIPYSLEFNRSPIVGNRMRLRGVYAEGRLGFTRPRSWKVANVKALIRFQHSPALYANRSNLTVLINDRAVGSVPLNKKQSQLGQVLLDINPKLLQDYNELKIVVQQNNSQECSNSNDPDLWTEVLPDSKLIFNYQRQPVALNFSRYPYPFFDDLSLETNSIAYLQPSSVSQSWLTGAARLQAALGRLADFRPIETNVVTNLTEVKPEQRLVIIGTPSEQPELATMKLPLLVASNLILDANKNPISEDIGVLIATINKTGSPVLIATGNGAKGVAKAAQFLAEPDLRRLGTGQVVLVNQVKEISTPGLRQWPRYLPQENTFRLGDIKTQVNGDPFNDVTVRGSSAPSIDIDFRALPDDRFVRGSSMNLVYSYSPQMNPRTSAVEVLLDNVFIGGARLDSDRGENRKNLKVDLPANLVKPNSKLQVFFRMNPREPFDKQNCANAPDQQLTGTVHADTSFDLKRESSVQLPDLKLLQFGYPFAAPQDLSKTAVVLPQNPTDTDILTLLALSERLGRLSRADSIKLDVYTSDSLPDTARKNYHLVGIGTREKFPLPEIFKSSGFNLSQAFFRSSAAGAVQTPQDAQGMIKQTISPWSGSRVVLALTAQTDTGLERVRQVLNQDPWFFQLKKDTVLISSDSKDVDPYSPDAYQLEFFQSSPSTQRLEDTNLLSKISRLLQENWLLLPAGIVGISLLMYGIVQLYLKRISSANKH
ncbi:cellulose biosynthesis cyclic di-GMP-binding regulatory protein BcsB [Iningainema tapete]|uniref:Cellulose biosynthesis cyclic di-GMP-binding regulatory protein BcsB n=1 Tax=Iningainema tapete BLCC-T55 TaxID=2748662 RepID=A0A8J6XN01_9CYAN|nr:cellulose biosynthesis cyclic di-GMP-binding regulatory protein BcsB [Iningainema tapete]MBD2774844.1 cellulose biosynthesis cyclic di-GMP-binding regulatory protein BcsB [Iningainema tapete BLCC-T55]